MIHTNNNSSESPAIVVNNVSKFYKLYRDPIDRLKESLNPLRKIYHKKFYALENFDLQVQRGQVVGFLGRNGSGKSTLLKILTGVLAPSTGTVQINGKITALLELGAGFNPEKTGLQNIYFNGALNGLSTEEIEEKVQEIIEFADIGDFINQPVKTYSSGMSARLAFSLAINVDPEVLIIDEILAVGDAAFQRKCFARIEEFREAKKTILFVTHSENQIIEICDKAVWINGGEKIVEGTPKFVVALYSKNAQESKLNAQKIAEEFNELVTNDKKPDKKSLQEKNNPPINTPIKKTIKSKALYSAALKPQSTIHYPEKGASIKNTQITTLEGEKVNILYKGEEYLYRYRVVFTKPVNKVLFGMMIKTKEGYVLGGGHYPGKDSFLQINGHTVDMTWRWRCNLIQGDYFLNSGVYDGSRYICRVLDTYMFRVQPEKKKQQEVGLINFDIKGELQTIEQKTCVTNE